MPTAAWRACDRLINGALIKVDQPRAHRHSGCGTHPLPLTRSETGVVALVYDGLGGIRSEANGHAAIAALVSACTISVRLAL